VDVTSPRLSQRRCSCRHRRPARVDVVDEDHPGRRSSDRPEAAADVGAPLGEAETALRTSRTRPLEERHDRQLPSGFERSRQPLGGVVAALERPVGVGRDICDRVRARARYDLRYEGACILGEPAEPELLPGGDERLRSGVVRDRRPGGGEREPPALTLATARDGPRGRSPAARAPRTCQPPKPGQARFADGARRRTAHDAAKRKQKIQEEPHTPTTLAVENARVSADSVSGLCQLHSVYRCPTSPRSRRRGTAPAPRSARRSRSPSCRA
jgi:hypothetical protein